jgi:DNA-binding NtrC family response regulator
LTRPRERVERAVAQALGSGAYDYLPKPVEKDLLRVTVGRQRGEFIHVIAHEPGLDVQRNDAVDPAPLP